MACSFERSIFYEYLDGATTPLENILIEEHINNCPRCRAELGSIMQLFRQLEDPGELPVPPELSGIKQAAFDLFMADIQEEARKETSKAAIKSGDTQKKPSFAIPVFLRQQALWLNNTASFIRYMPGAKGTSGATGNIVKKTGRFAGKALYKALKKLTLTAAVPGRA